MWDNVQAFLHGNGLSRLMDGQIFYPSSETTKLMSDSLYLPSIFYGLVKSFVPGLFASYNVQILFLSLFSFLVYCYFFSSLATRKLHSYFSTESSWMAGVSFFGFAAFFSVGRLLYFMYTSRIYGRFGLCL